MAVIVIDDLVKNDIDLRKRKLFQYRDLETICHAVHTGVAEEDF